MASEMVERVANAISRECRLMGDGIGPSAANEAARAAIEAMAQPSEAMIRDVADNLDEWESQIERTWRAMIAVALTEAGK